MKEELRSGKDTSTYKPGHEAKSHPPFSFIFDDKSGHVIVVFQLVWHVL